MGVQHRVTSTPRSKDAEHKLAAAFAATLSSKKWHVSRASDCTNPDVFLCEGRWVFKGQSTALRCSSASRAGIPRDQEYLRELAAWTLDHGNFARVPCTIAATATSQVLRQLVGEDDNIQAGQFVEDVQNVVRGSLQDWVEHKCCSDD